MCACHHTFPMTNCQQEEKGNHFKVNERPKSTNVCLTKERQTRD